MDIVDSKRVGGQTGFRQERPQHRIDAGTAGVRTGQHGQMARGWVS